MLTRGCDVDDQRDHQPCDRPQRPHASEPVQDHRIPEQARWQEDKAEHRPECRGEQAIEPCRERPEQHDGDPGREQRQQGEEQGHRAFVLRYCDVPNRVASSAYIAISIRRFHWRPASVSLVAIGSASPRPIAVIRARLMPICSRKSVSAFARRCDRSRLRSVPPCVSVCPTIMMRVVEKFSNDVASRRRLSRLDEDSSSDSCANSMASGSVTTMPPPRSCTIAPGRSNASSCACLSICLVIAAPTGPDAPAPRMALRTVAPVSLPTGAALTGTAETWLR